MSSNISEQNIDDLWAEIKTVQRQVSLLVKNESFGEDAEFTKQTNHLEERLKVLSAEMENLTDSVDKLSQPKLLAAINDMKDVQDRIQNVINGAATAIELAQAVEILAKFVIPFI